MPTTKRQASKPAASSRKTRQPAASKSKAAPRSKARTTSAAASSSRRSAAGTRTRSRARSAASSSSRGDTRSRSRSRARETSGRRSRASSSPRPKRPMTAYMAFIQAKTKNVSMSRVDCSARMKELAAEWRSMTDEQKREFQALADRANGAGGRTTRASSRQSQ